MDELEKIKMVKIRPKGETAWLVQTPEELVRYIKDATHDEGKWDLVLCEMTPEQIEGLEEFDGW